MEKGGGREKEGECREGGEKANDYVSVLNGYGKGLS